MDEVWGTLSGHTADEFAAFFAEKQDSVCQSTSSTPPPHVPATAKQELREWVPVRRGKADQRGAKQEQSAGHGPDMVGQAVQRATGSVHRSAFQHVTLYWVLSNQA